MGVVTSLHPLTFIVALIQHSRTTVRACDEHNDDYNDVTVRDMLAVKNHDNTATTDCDETIDNTDDNCMFDDCNNRFLVKAYVSDVELLSVRDTGNFGGILASKELVSPEQIIPRKFRSLIVQEH